MARRASLLHALSTNASLRTPIPANALPPVSTAMDALLGKSALNRLLFLPLTLAPR